MTIVGRYLTDCQAKNHPLGCKCGFGPRGAEERSNRAFVKREEAKRRANRREWEAAGFVNPNRQS